jgi:hypothetical protein
MIYNVVSTVQQAFQPSAGSCSCINSPVKLPILIPFIDRPWSGKNKWVLRISQRWTKVSRRAIAQLQTSAPILGVMYKRYTNGISKDRHPLQKKRPTAVQSSAPIQRLWYELLELMPYNNHCYFSFTQTELLENIHSLGHSPHNRNKTQCQQKATLRTQLLAPWRIGYPSATGSL